MFYEIRANAFKVFTNVPIPIAQHGKTQAVQIQISLFIFLAFKMLRSVNFYHGFCFSAIKINDIFSDYLLSVYREGKSFKN